VSTHLTRRQPRAWGRGCRRRTGGFTLAELLITVAVIGILSAVAVNVLGVREWQRSRVNAVAMELNGWLEAVRRSALKGTGCRVTIQTASAAAAGAVIASAAPVTNAAVTVPNTCMSQQPLRILSNAGNDVFAISSDPATFTFTPRGTARGLSNGTENDLEIRIALNGGLPMRCVQLTSPLGVVRIGYNDTAVNGTCLYPGSF
jgi:prepilin-type N-terminal cleavage/methylation domain-containing protein